MSMPSFPPGGANLTREEALTMIIASIAMEELALSHILNAEGEKLQYILGTLPGSKPCAGHQDVLAVNKSVASLLDVVAQNQMLLKSKLEKVLEVCPPPAPPCPPPAPPCWEPEPIPPCKPPCEGPHRAKSVLQLAQRQPGLTWARNCRLPWRQLVQRGDGLCWKEQSPDKICLNPEKAYAVQYTLNIRRAHLAEDGGAVLLKQTPCGAFSEALPLYFQLERCRDRTQTLQYAAVLYPRMGCGSEAELSLVLEAPSVVCVERAILNIMEL